jgi:hypothetical protein
MKFIKPQFIWQPEHISAGMVVCRAHRGSYRWEPDGWTAKWTYKIGFISGSTVKMIKHPNGEYEMSNLVLVALTDGMVQGKGFTHKEMAEYLNSYDMIPMSAAKYRQMNKYLENQSCPNLKKISNLLSSL